MNILTYLRVSTDDQTLEPQRLELASYCDRQGWTVAGEFSDVLSGAKAARPGLDALLDRCELGGVEAVCVVKLDRLGRSLINVVKLVCDLADLGVAVICTSQGVDTRESSPCGKMVMGMLAVCAEFERDIVRERTVAGLKVARAAGKRLGRPSPVLIAEPGRSEAIAEWQAEGSTYKDLATRLGGVSISTAHRLANARYTAQV